MKGGVVERGCRKRGFSRDGDIPSFCLSPRHGSSSVSFSFFFFFLNMIPRLAFYFDSKPPHGSFACDVKKCVYVCVFAYVRVRVSMTCPPALLPQESRADIRIRICVRRHHLGLRFKVYRVVIPSLFPRYRHKMH